MFATEIHCCDDVRYVHAPRDDTRSSVNHSIIDFASFIVTCVTWLNQLATHVASQGSSSVFAEHHVSSTFKTISAQRTSLTGELIRNEEMVEFSTPRPVGQTSSGSTRD